MDECLLQHANHNLMALMFLFGLDSPKFVEEGLCGLQVLRVEPFGEPVVNLEQRGACFLLLSLSLPQPHQAHHRP